MNAFIPENPTVVLQVSKDGTAVIRSANNIDRNLNIVLVESNTDFIEAAANQPFNSTAPLVQGPLSSVTSKARYANTTTSAQACLPIGCLTNDGKLVTRA